MSKSFAHPSLCAMTGPTGLLRQFPSPIIHQQLCCWRLLRHPVSPTAALHGYEYRKCSTKQVQSPLALQKVAEGGELPPIIDTPLPPRPAFYVPPEQRDPEDESLAFMKGGSPLEHIKPKVLPDGALPHGVDAAPSLKERNAPQLHYMDADASRLRSTSVHAGHPLVGSRTTIDTGAYYFDDPKKLGVGGNTRHLHAVLEEDSQSSGRVPNRSRTTALQDKQPTKPAGVFLGGGGVGGHSLSSTTKERTIFAASHEYTPMDTSTEEVEDAKERTTPKPKVRQLEADIKKLEYYYGTPQYEKLLTEFRKKYEHREEEEGDSATRGVSEGREYSADEKAKGLETQPIDYLRGSVKLQTQLTSGPRAYDPITVMQQHGVLHFQGYAFPPSTELGKLKGDPSDLTALIDQHKTNPIVARVRRGFNALVGRRDARDDYLAGRDAPKEDQHLLYRTVGLDAVQRRQMRYMLTDFDYADRHTAFHVMMSYPYTDWIHAFYMVLVGWCIYQLQVILGAYEFYDEYMGLDLRQVPRMQKPVLVGITVVVMVFLLFQPLLVASIATTRAYRIVTRRPLGPP